MTVETAERRTVALQPSRTVFYGVLALVAISVVGAVISVTGDLSPDMFDAMGPEGRLSIPLPMIAAQISLGYAAGSCNRRVALIGSGLLAVALLASVVSGFFDGGYADDRFTAFERAYQLFLVAALTTVGVLAAARFRRALR